MQTTPYTLLLLLLALIPAAGVAQDEVKTDPALLAAFQKDLAAKVVTAEKANATAVRGKDGWLFLTAELRHMSAGTFWGEAAAKVSKVAPDIADPLPAILDFKAQLDKANIELLLVPVPAKVTIYPEMLTDTVPATAEKAPPRLDAAQQEFFALLRQHGIKVLDLTPIFLQHRFDKEGALFCRTDTHWSGRACEMAAGLIAAQIADRPWLKDVPKHTYVCEQGTASIAGDLITLLGDNTIGKEELPFTFVKEKGADGTLKPIDSWRESPVVLLGDSHNLIFSIGDDMLLKNAGLPDNLAAKLGFPVDLAAARGAESTPARINLMRRRDNLAGKKLVIWCFTVRGFTESTQGWKKVPVIR